MAKWRLPVRARILNTLKGHCHWGPSRTFPILVKYIFDDVAHVTSHSPLPSLRNCDHAQTHQQQTDLIQLRCARLPSPQLYRHSSQSSQSHRNGTPQRRKLSQPRDTAVNPQIESLQGPFQRRQLAHEPEPRFQQRVSQDVAEG